MQQLIIKGVYWNEAKATAQKQNLKQKSVIEFLSIINIVFNDVIDVTKGKKYFSFYLLNFHPKLGFASYSS